MKAIRLLRNTANSKLIRRAKNRSNQPSHFVASFVGQDTASGGLEVTNTGGRHQLAELELWTKFEGHQVAEKHDKQ